MRRSLICIALMLILLSGELAAQMVPPSPQQGDTMPEIVRRHRDYFATIGTARGSGFKQYMRWEERAAPRSYPSGDLLNTTALTWLHHHQAARSPALLADKAAAAAAGIGTGNWRLVGPKRSSQDLSQNDADIGRINAVAFHPSDPAILYAGSPAAGLWRSKDGGGHWDALTDELPLMGVSDIAIDPLGPATVFILTGDGDGRDTPSIGIWKSSDAGETWRPTGLVWKADQVEYGYRLAIHPTTPTILFAATTSGLLRTEDGGDRWSTAIPAADRLNPFFDVLFHPTNPSIAYAASRTQVYRSTDTGKTWSPMSGGLPTDQTANRIRLGVSPASPDTLYVLYGSPTGFTIGLYRSDDSGTTFTKRSSSNPPSANPANPFPIDLSKPNILGYYGNDFGSQSHYDLAMAVSPTNIDRVHVGGIDTWRSDDGGGTWQITSRWTAAGSPGYTHADIHVLAYRGEALYAGSDGGIYRSMDAGESWVPLTAGMAIAQIYALCGTREDPDLLYYGAQDNGTYRLSLNGAVSKVNGGDGFVCQIHPKDANIVYSSLYYGDIYRSDDGGNSFKKLPAPASGSGAWLTPYALGVADADHIYACYADLWHSRDRGFEWKNLTNGALGGSRECRQVVIAPSDPSTIYVAKSAERDANREVLERTPFLGGGGVFRTTDGGTTWQSITGTLPTAKASITHIGVSPTDARRAWVTFSGYDAAVKVFETKDGGTTWTNLSDGLPNLPVNTIAAQNTSSHGVYVGTDVGVYYRDERLSTWIPFMDGLPRSIVTWLLIDEARQRLFAATFARGIWQSELASSPVASAASPQQSASYTGPLGIFE